ncbi:MAG: protein kinase domain-containing protein [Planctomycetota bacterium]|jgi:serine/threonine-protein kinase
MSEIADRLQAALADRYRIERELGRGGMATVYLAEDLKHERKVALKVLRSELAAALGKERFLREITTTANLRHPHILPLYDSGEAGDFLYYVMPWVEGESLRERLDREKQLPVDDALAIARDVADALGYAHARGVVHRDVKPENILLDGGHAVVADFGIARALSAAGADRLTQTGVSIGTPTYMSPEQAAGDAELDGRSDLYSLGCVLYEMLGGQPPFTGPTAETVSRQHLIAEAAPITNLRPTVPARVAGALARTLTKNPADRFNPAAQFVEALSAADVVPPSAPATTSLRSPIRIALMAGGLAIVIAAAWFGGRALSRPGPGASIERIAVLPMDNQTGDSTQAFFANGMTRELIGVLTDADVRVLGYRAVTAYANTTLSAAQIARELEVDAIVSGAVIQAGEVLQVAAELTDPETNENLWAKTFSRPAPDVVTLQREIALEIARGIQARLTPDQERALGAAPPVDPRAYALYLLGQEELNLRTPESIRRSVAYLDRALALDSTFGPAWATLALANSMGFFYGAIPSDSARAATEQATQRALALDPTLGDALIARGLMRFLLDWDFTAAAEDLRRGMARNPTTLAQAFYTYFPWGTAQPEEATRVALNLVDVEPTTAQWQSDAGWIRWAAGDSAAARAYSLRAIELDSTFAEPNMILGFIDADGGDIAAARRAAARAARLAPDYPLLLVLDGYISARAGDTAEARDVLRELSRERLLAQQALVYAALGEQDSMYVLFERAIDAREPDALWFLNAVPALLPLRHEPRYQALLERMGLPEELRR